MTGCARGSEVLLGKWTLMGDGCRFNDAMRRRLFPGGAEGEDRADGAQERFRALVVGCVEGGVEAKGAKEFDSVTESSEPGSKDSYSGRDIFLAPLTTEAQDTVAECSDAGSRHASLEDIWTLR